MRTVEDTRDDRAAHIAQVVADVATGDGSAVEIAGVRIERCDERGKTETTIDLEQTRLDLADAHKRINHLEVVVLGSRQRALAAEAELEELQNLYRKQLEDLLASASGLARDKDNLMARLVDVDTVLVRLKQIDAEQRPEHWLWDRVMTCDVPRLTELAALFGRDAA